jgi:hypothetical protein
MGAVAVLLVLAMIVILAQTMGPASAEAKSGHGHGGAGRGGQPKVELTSQVNRHSSSDDHSSRGNNPPGSRKDQGGNNLPGSGKDQGGNNLPGSGKDQGGNNGNGRGRGQTCVRQHGELTSSRGHERASIASPITLPANTVPNTTVPPTTPTTQPPRSTTTATTAPPTTQPTSPSTVPPIVGNGTPSSPAPTTGPAATSASPPLGPTITPIQGLALLATTSAPSTTAPKGAKGKITNPGGNPSSVLGVSGTLPQAPITGGWKGLSFRAVTNLKVPILFGVVVALFVLGQALIDRRDPKMSRAPERNDEDTVGFQ